MKRLIALLAAAGSLFVLSACDSMEGPSPLDTRASDAVGDLNGSDLPSDSAMQDGLQGRGINDLSSFEYGPEDIVATVYFGFDQYAIGSGERGKVKQAADFYSSNPELKIVLYGYTDWYGTEEYNMLLSDKRCKAVLDYFGGLGIGPDRIEIIAKGEAGATMDVAKNSPEAKHDRRVDIVKFSK